MDVLNHDVGTGPGRSLQEIACPGDQDGGRASPFKKRKEQKHDGLQSESRGKDGGIRPSCQNA